MTLGIGAPTEPPRKYRNKPTVVDGIRFDSKAEARRYGELKLLEKAGEITDLQLQPSFKLHAMKQTGKTFSGISVEFVVIGKYVADFAYTENGETVCEDVKSPATEKNAMFRWKRKHFEAEYGIKLRVIR